MEIDPVYLSLDEEKERTENLYNHRGSKENEVDY